MARHPAGTAALSAAIMAVLPIAAAQAQQAKNDPLYRYQWHLTNYGQGVLSDARPAFGIDLGIDDLHDFNIRGRGVIVSVVDTGVEIAHPDLAANVVPDGSWNFNDGSHDPTPAGGAAHGTAVAGIIGAVGWNGIGVRGVAPGARLKSFNFLDSDGDAAQQQYAWWDGAEAKDVQVSNNSWGYVLPMESRPISQNEIAAWERSMTSTRGGLGAIYVKAAGNGFDYVENDLGGNICVARVVRSGVGCDQTIWDESSNFFNVMTIAAVNAAGKRSSYSTPGASLWVSGLGGEYGNQANTLREQGYSDEEIADFDPVLFEPAIVTTDRGGCARGYNVGRSVAESSNALDSELSAIDDSCDYAGTMNGTSAATPTVAGVAALMLQANPRLSYRDVKYLLATTARRVDPQQARVVNAAGTVVAPGWTVNAAGRAFSNWYGFGLVDASLAVNAAAGFKSLPALIDSGWQRAAASDTQRIGAADAPARLSLALASGIRRVEAVQIAMTTNANHGNDFRAPATPLLVTLVSPGGTRAYVLPAGAGYVGRNSALTIPFASVNAFLDESGDGEWTLEVANTDLASGDRPGSRLTSFKIRVLGH